MPNCKCGNYGYLYGSEIDRWTGPPFERLECLWCGRPTLWQRVLYWWYGYTVKSKLKDWNYGHDADAGR